MKYEYAVCAVFFVMSIVMAIQDIKTQKVSRVFSIILLSAMVAARIIFTEGNEKVGFIASAVIGLVLYEAVRLITKKKLGLADVFYSGSAGALLGFDMWLASCAIACVAAVCVIAYRVRKAPPEKKVNGLAEILRVPVPFVPCMFLGAVVSKAIIFFA